MHLLCDAMWYHIGKSALKTWAQCVFIYQQSEAEEKMRLDLSQHAITQRIDMDLAVNNLLKPWWRLQSDWNIFTLQDGVVLVRSVTPKPLEIVITLPVYTSSSTTPSPSFTVWKTKAWDSIQGEIRFVCALFSSSTCLPGLLCGRLCRAEAERWQHLLQGALMSGSHCLRARMTGE